MEAKESIEIPFGAFDSELKGWEYTIPEGMEAVIKDGKIIVREKEGEDERIRKAIRSLVLSVEPDRLSILKITQSDCLAWLEKQGSQNLANSAKTCKDEQKPAWSDEDEEVFHCLEYTVKHYYDDKDTINQCCSWLKSLKDRFNVNNEKEK